MRKELEKILGQAWMDYWNTHIDNINENYPQYTPREHVTSAYSDDVYRDLHDFLPVESEFGAISFVEQRGGEGDGAPMFVTIKVGDQYFEAQGRYSSWDESTWEPEFYEVFPEEVTVTKFRRK